MFSPEDSPASLSPTQGKEKDMQMTAISGQKCSELLTKSGQLGSLVKMLLGSPLWWSPAKLLTWKVQPLSLKRVVEFTDSEQSTPSQSNASAETLSKSDIPSNRCLFRLVLSERHTEETESSSLPVLLQTPTAVMTCESPERMRARAERKGYQNGTKYGSLESQIIYDPNFKHLLPTPTTIQGGPGKLNEQGKKVYHEGKKGGAFSAGLHDLAHHGMLPTPTARDHKGGITAIRKDTGRQRLDQLDSFIAIKCSQKTDGNGFRLSPPVHRGNDGLPFDVDDLTISFSKWRNESLKAYGNAIVPQVMYRIFQCIEQLNV